MTMTTTARAKRWKYIRHEGRVFYDVGINADGTVDRGSWNQQPEDVVRAAIAAAEARAHQRRSEAAKKAAITRRRRQEKRVYEVTKRIIEGHRYGPAASCCICGKGLSDAESIERGIGSDCWQTVLANLTDAKAVGA